MQLKSPVLLKYEEPYHWTAVWPDDLPLPNGTTSEPGNHDRHFEMQTQGPWSLLVNLRALAIEKCENGVLVYGDRNMRYPRENGCAQFGRVSVDGKKRRAFTSSMLVTHKGQIYSFAVLCLCTEKKA
jgi:hypothetical protein